jgi:hemerythrin-like domain-containing protein
MLPVEILISEHRLILHTVGILKKGQQQIVASSKIDPNFVVASVDFFRTYADRYHHGKEEGILFNELYKRKLSEADGAMMRELILEHATARRTVTTLEIMKDNYIIGKTDSSNGILEALNVLIELYPRHIEKEDKHFFHPSMTYFTEKEQNKMLRQFQEFNQTFTDNRYKLAIENLEKGL